ncbi:hypothetical protein C5167_010032 [Papaver somniferum]|uniref:Uncharacterized protein n=1 Tax=Papaver somniferum TaxID=3469 RepID=A0A4Y7K087_PAPSO|nr:hypothetical protein C5167_010032 [Papaver somniferum]
MEFSQNDSTVPDSTEGAGSSSSYTQIGYTQSLNNNVNKASYRRIWRKIQMDVESKTVNSVIDNEEEEEDDENRSQAFLRKLRTMRMIVMMDT